MRLNLDDLKGGDIVDILYTTYNTNEPRLRSLKNLKVLEQHPTCIRFIQKGKRQKLYTLNKEDIKAVLTR